MASQVVVKLDGAGAWPDMADHRERIIQVGEGDTIEIACLEGGMTSGRPSLAFRINLPDGRIVFAEMSVRSFQAAATIIRAKFGEVD